MQVPEPIGDLPGVDLRLVQHPLIDAASDAGHLSAE
jgi:hypothetical protein